MKLWQLQEKNEKLAMQMLGWTEIQVAQSTQETIAKALHTHQQVQLEKKKELPPVLVAEPIIKLTWPKSHTFPIKTALTPTPSTTMIIPPVDIHEEEEEAKHSSPVLNVQTSPQLLSLTPPPPPPSPTPTSTTTTSTTTNAEFKDEPIVAAIAQTQVSNLIGKTPGFLREQQKLQTETLQKDVNGLSPEDKCKDLVLRLKQLLLRRNDHDTHLSNMSLDTIQRKRLLESFDRTNQYIWDCMGLISQTKTQITAEIQSKQALLSWTDVQCSPDILTELATDIANLSVCLCVLSNMNRNILSA